MIYFTSDLHLGHQNIIGFCDRPFKDVIDMNLGLRDRHNSLVKPDDTVYYLGDVVMGNVQMGLEFLKTFNGRKYLIPGNHDRVFSDRSQTQYNKYEKMYLDVFSEILPEQVDYFNWLLCHFPYSDDHTQEVRYKDKRPKDNGRILLCGHVHDMWKSNGKQINVGVDVWEWYPVSIDRIKSLVERV